MKSLFILLFLFCCNTVPAQQWMEFNDSARSIRFTILSCRCDSALLDSDSLQLAKKESDRLKNCSDSNSLYWPAIELWKYGTGMNFFSFTYQTIPFGPEKTCCDEITGDSMTIFGWTSRGYYGYYQLNSDSTITLRFENSFETYRFRIVVTEAEVKWYSIPGPNPGVFTWDEWYPPARIPIE